MSYYLGFDSSTQSLKAILVDPNQWIVSDALCVNFGRDLPEFLSPTGYAHATKGCRADPKIGLTLGYVWPPYAEPLGCRKLRNFRLRAQHGSVF